MAGSTGPAIRAVCRVVNQNSCGSGSICGHWNGGSLVLTNAHVAGTKIGRVVRVEVESLGMRKLNASVIRAAYSNSVSADWALLHIPDFQEIQPVYLTKNPPPAGLSLYTKGFPTCQPHNGTDITQAATLKNGVLLWKPNAIGGQSGSGVWGDDDNLQYALLTWSMQYSGRWLGGGQLTSEIYKQNRSAEVRGYARMPNLIELPSFDFADVDRDGLDDPVVEEGFFSIPLERNIQDFPIWAEDQTEPPPGGPTEPPTDPNDPEVQKRAIESIRRIRDLANDELKRWEENTSRPIAPDAGSIGETFGL